MAYPTNDLLNNTPLGMYFQGQSIGDEQRLNREKSEAHGLKYLMDQMTAGNDLAKSDLEGARAGAMNTPEMLDLYTRGYGGQMNSQIAAGKKAMGLVNSEIALGNTENANKLSYEEMLKRLWKLKQQAVEGGGDPVSTGGIGFNMQPQVDPNIKGQFTGDQPTLNKAYESIQRITDPQIRAEAMQAWKNSGNQYTGTRVMTNPQGLNQNDSVLSRFNPQRNGGITPGNPEYERVMNALVDLPKTRTSLITGDQKLDSAEYIANRKIEAEIEKNRIKSEFEKDPKTAEEVVARILQKQRNGVALTEADITVYNLASGVLNAKNAARVQPGVMINTEALTPGSEAPILENKPPQTTIPAHPQTSGAAPAAPPKKMTDEELIKHYNKPKG